MYKSAISCYWRFGLMVGYFAFLPLSDVVYLGFGSSWLPSRHCVWWGNVYMLLSIISFHISFCSGRWWVKIRYILRFSWCVVYIRVCLCMATYNMYMSVCVHNLWDCSNRWKSMLPQTGLFWGQCPLGRYSRETYCSSPLEPREDWHPLPSLHFIQPRPSPG